MRGNDSVSRFNYNFDLDWDTSGTGMHDMSTWRGMQAVAFRINCDKEKASALQLAHALLRKGGQHCQIAYKIGLTKSMRCESQALRMHRVGGDLQRS